jgi:carbamoylphosphate synthase small subunit
MDAVLALEDGTTFRGRAAGAEGEAAGEVVFNTSMTGYQEVLTDPSYSGQIVTMTCPEIGNYGVTSEDVESRGVIGTGRLNPDDLVDRAQAIPRMEGADLVKDVTCAAPFDWRDPAGVAGPDSLSAIPERQARRPLRIAARCSLSGKRTPRR